MNKYNVLVVDDEKEIRDAIEIYLKNEGIKVLRLMMVWSFKCFGKEEIHLILMDIMMPKMDGIRLLLK